MRTQFGDIYAESVAKDHVLSALGGRTVSQALADGTDAKTVWRAVCETFNIPEFRADDAPMTRRQRADG
jgi:hypothetical protein